MRRLRLVPGALLAAGAGFLATSGGCTTQPVDSSLRALEESGRISFVCLGDPRDGSPILPLSKCRNVRADNACDFEVPEGGAGGAGGTAGTGGTGGTAGTAGAGGDPPSSTGGGGFGGDGFGGDGGTAGTAGTPDPGSGGATVIGTPHLYGLVTQTFRGEVAVLDFTTQANDRIVDQDPTVPGPSFIPVGAQPVGIVSTPGGTATFVTVAEVGREGIYAIPSGRILRPRRDDDGRCQNVWDEMPEPARISSWPACSLPAAPGEPILVNDPAGADGKERARCDEPPQDPGDEVPGVDNGELYLEGLGRQKLVVPLPELGGVAIIDAQTLLDLPDGSFEPCPVDRWVLLDSEVPPVVPPQPSDGQACVNPAPPEPSAVTGSPLPSGMAFAESTLYVSDLALPLIHRFAMESPCEPVLLPPLLPFAIEEPRRTVTTSRLAVTPRPTASLQRYLYANDVGEGTVMVFDVSDGATTRTPLVRSHPEWTPLQPRDRVRFVSAPRDIIVVSRDLPIETPGTGVATEGVLCDPDPSLPCCDPQRDECKADTSSCDLSTQYRTAPDFSTGAGPFKLRGTFAFVLLTNGQIEVIDIEDLDAACRVPALPDPLLGCDTIACKGEGECPFGSKCTLPEESAVDGFCVPEDQLVSSDEISCNVVTPNTLRSSVFVLDDQSVGFNRPGLASFPLLFDSTGALLETTDPTVPVMRATLPDDGGGDPEVSINGTATPLTAENGSPVGGVGHVLLMNEETPRSQTAAQNWTITFEGPLPRYGGAAAELRVKGADGAPLVDPGLFDSNAIYCDGGVQSFEALREQLAAASPTPPDQAEIDKQARSLADRAEMADFLTDSEDEYWDTPGLACSYDQCRGTFGDGEAPLPARSFLIREAYQDRLVLEAVSDGGATLDEAKCCFPSLVAYNVRPANQWIVVGQGNGFMHHVIADPATGVCRPSCDPVEARMNGRVLRTPNTFRNARVPDGSPTAFINQMFRFAIVDGTEPPQRDMQLRFATSGGFRPLTVTLLSDTRNIAPVGITFVPPTGELAVTDGSLQGVITVNLASVQSARQFF